MIEETKYGSTEEITQLRSKLYTTRINLLEYSLNQKKSMIAELTKELDMD